MPILNHIKSLQHCHSEIPSSLSPWPAYLLPLTLLLPGFLPAFIWGYSLTLAFHLPGDLMLTSSAEGQIHPGSLNWAMCTSRNIKEFTKGCVWSGEVLRNQFPDLQLLYILFPKTNFAWGKAYWKRTSSYFSLPLLFLLFYSKDNAFLFLPFLPKVHDPRA